MTTRCADLTDVIQLASDRMQNITLSMLDLGVSVGDWQMGLWAEIKRSYIHTMAHGRGGWDFVTFEDRQRVTTLLREEAKYLMGFAQQTGNGDLTRGEITSRVNMYAAHLQQVCWDIATGTASEAGATHESRHTQPAEHCDDCVGYEREGRQVIGYFPEPGQGSQCLSNCKCIKKYWRITIGGWTEVNNA